MELSILFGIIVLFPKVLSITLSGNGTSGGFTVQENASLRITCSTTMNVIYVAFYSRERESRQFIGSVGYGTSGCGTTPAQLPPYLECSCISRREYACDIRAVTSDMNGDVWLCVLPSGSVTDESGDKTIVVTVGITSVSMVFPVGSPVFVIEKHTRQFKCETSAGNPNASVEWYKDNGTPDRADDTQITTGTETDTTASGTLVVTIGTLTLTVNRDDHNVSVYCKANNGGAWLFSSSVVLDVQYGPSTPKITYNGNEVGSAVRVISGRSITLTCSSTGNPNPTYTWTHPSVGSQNGSSLTLSSLQTTHIGTVTCTAGNTLSQTEGTDVVKTNKTTTNLQVLYPPLKPSCSINGTSILTTTILVQGTDRTISCTSSANPPKSTYIWSTPSSRQVFGASLYLTNVQHTADHGQYTLTVTNTMDPTGGNTETGTSNTSFSVDVQYEPSVPIINYMGTKVSSAVRVISGRSMTLNCSSKGNPSPTYTWTYPSERSQIGASLTLSDMKTTNAGDVTCTAGNMLSPTGGTTVVKTKPTTIILQVLYPPSSPTCTVSGISISTSAILVEHTDRTIRCTSSANPTKIRYIWTTPGREQVLGAILSLTNVQYLADHGQYTLTATNTMDPTGIENETGTSNTTFSVDVQFKPQVQLPGTSDVLENSALNYSCPFIPGNPSNTSLVWTRSIDNTQWTSKIVYIGSVQKSDDGMYTCTATNNLTPTGLAVQIGEHSGTMHINVQYESRVSKFYVTEHIGMFNVTQAENSNVTFNCTVDSNPLSTINIRKDGEMKSSVTYSKQLEYSIANITCWDAGLYTCEARNKFNNATPSKKDMKLFVTCSPRRPPGEEIRLNYTARQHDHATLQYTVFAYPVPSLSQFVWKNCTRSKNCTTLSDQPGKIQITTMGLSSNLSILDIDVDDYGIYSISVGNTIGEILVEEIYLQPAGPPDSPKEFHVIEASISETQAILSWIPGFNNGFSQTFHLSYGPLLESATITKVNISHNEFEESINYTINKLEPEKQYYVELFASNAEGKSMTDNATFTTLVHLVKGPGGPSAAIIGGSIGGGICAVLIIGGVILGVMKLRKLGNKNDRESLTAEKRRETLSHDADEDNELPDVVENSMYVPAGDISRHINNSGADALYAQPNKTKVPSSAGTELYAEVNKVAKKKATAKKHAKKTFENKAFEDSTYENHELPEKKKNVNKDGLVYADLDFPKPPKGQKPYIHGLDDMTVYADVDLSQKADPLPDSDDDASGGQ